ncbi:MAG: hypothetical protein DRJ38_00085 [Thermoprotei archaeon]|nr:MAG: hypothetical protein DRJ38_00085 [Thermoprotei archaeon]
MAEEYRRMKTKEVVTSSGARFVIRKMPLSAFLQMIQIYDKVPPTEEGARQILPDIVRVILPACVVEPPIGEGPDKISVDELDAADAFELIAAINEFSGLTEAAERQRRSFRTQQSRKARRAAMSTTATPK